MVDGPIEVVHAIVEYVPLHYNDYIASAICGVCFNNCGVAAPATNA